MGGDDQDSSGWPPATLRRDVAGQIKSLHELRNAGALTEEEFVSQKQKLLTGNFEIR
jgi:hypothetical protein